MAVPTKQRTTLADLLAIEDHDRLEIIGGEIVDKALPSWRHARAETKYGEILAPFNRKPGGPRGPGGWWIGTEVHVGYGEELYCHDVAGWRRDRVPAMPDELPVLIRPDWVCEIVSPKHEKRDFVTKPQTLHAAEVPYYWLLHPEEQNGTAARPAGGGLHAHGHRRDRGERDLPGARRLVDDRSVSPERHERLYRGARARQPARRPGPHDVARTAARSCRLAPRLEPGADLRLRRGMAGPRHPRSGTGRSSRSGLLEASNRRSASCG